MVEISRLSLGRGKKTDKPDSGDSGHFNVIIFSLIISGVAL